VSPAPDSSIQFNVYVSACEDFKLGEPVGLGMSQYTLWPTPTRRNQNDGNPNGNESANGNGPKIPPPGLLPTILEYEPQSGMADLSATSGGETDSPTNPEPLDTIAAPTSAADQTMNVFFGEAPTSIRELNRRYIKNRTEAFGPPVSGPLRVYTLNDKGLGYYSGYDPNGIDNDGSNNLTICNVTYAQFFSPCYAGWRGATRTKYMFVGESGQPIVTRAGYTNAAYKSSSDPDPSTLSDWSVNLTRRVGREGAAGSATTNLGINDTIETETPYYNGVRFTTSRMPSGDFVNGCHANKLQIDTFSTQQGPSSAVASYVNMFKSVGEDFTFFFFTGTPIIYRNDPPLP
jgi:hypothetical protein